MDATTEGKVAELAAATAALPSADPVSRARAAKELIERAKKTYSRVRQESIVEALASGRTYEGLAADLGVSTSTINAAVTAIRPVKLSKFLRGEAIATDVADLDDQAAEKLPVPLIGTIIPLRDVVTMHSTRRRVIPWPYVRGEMFRVNFSVGKFSSNTPPHLRAQPYAVARLYGSARHVAIALGGPANPYGPAEVWQPGSHHGLMLYTPSRRELTSLGGCEVIGTYDPASGSRTGIVADESLQIYSLGGALSRDRRRSAPRPSLSTNSSRPSSVNESPDSQRRARTRTPAASRQT